MLDQAKPREPIIFSSDLVGETVPATGGGLPDIVDGGNNFKELRVGVEEVAGGGHQAKAAAGSKDEFIFEGFFGIVAFIGG